MSESELLQPYITMRVVYEDLPDLIEIQTRVSTGSWTGVARAYASPDSLRNEAHRLEAWSDLCQGDASIQIGADTGIGWTVLRFYPIDRAGHTCCHLQLASGNVTSKGRPEQIWRLAMELETEPGLIQRFAKELHQLVNSLDGEAVLKCKVS